MSGDTGTFVADIIPSVDSSRWSGDTSSINGTADLQDDSRGLLGLERCMRRRWYILDDQALLLHHGTLTNSWPLLENRYNPLK